MALEKTYEQVIDTFETLSTRHYQVNGFINNHPLQVNGSDLTFPVVAIYPGASTIDRSVLNLNIKLFVMDLLNNDYTNEKSIQSDCLQIGNDFIQELYQGELQYGFVIDESTVTFELFGENYESSENTDISDDVAGCFFEFTVQVQNTFDDCILPFAAPTSTTTATTKYYIAATTDIVGYQMNNTIDASADDAGGSQIQTHSDTGWIAADNLYVGRSTNLGEYVKSDILISNDGNKNLVLTTTTYKQDAYLRIAKLTSFTTATYGNTLTTVSQLNKEQITYTGADQTSIYPVGTIIRITKNDGNYIYDIVTKIEFKSGLNTIKTYMGYYQAHITTTLTVDKMTGIS